MPGCDCPVDDSDECVIAKRGDSGRTSECAIDESGEVQALSTSLGDLELLLSPTL